MELSHSTRLFHGKIRVRFRKDGLVVASSVSPTSLPSQTRQTSAARRHGSLITTRIYDRERGTTSPATTPAPHTAKAVRLHRRRRRTALKRRAAVVHEAARASPPRSTAGRHHRHLRAVLPLAPERGVCPVRRVREGAHAFRDRV